MVVDGGLEIEEYPPVWAYPLTCHLPAYGSRFPAASRQVDPISIHWLFSLAKPESHACTSAVARLLRESGLWADCTVWHAVWVHQSGLHFWEGQSFDFMVTWAQAEQLYRLELCSSKLALSEGPFCLKIILCRETLVMLTGYLGWY